MTFIIVNIMTIKLTSLTTVKLKRYRQNMTLIVDLSTLNRWAPNICHR